MRNPNHENIMKRFFLFLSLALTILATAGHAQSENLFSRTLEVDSAAIKSSFTTEVVLVKSPSPDYIIVPVSVTTQFLYIDPYNDNSGASQISYAGSSTALVNLSTILASNAETIRSDGITGAALASTAAKGKDLVYKHTTANPTGGRSTLRFHILYRLVNVTQSVR